MLRSYFAQMKRFFTLLLAASCFAAVGQGDLQRLRQGFIDTNLGLAILGEGGIPFPGASLLGGVRTISSSDVILEFEAGLAFPAVATAKVGFGKRNLSKGTSTTFGVRIFPMHVYFQRSFSTDRCADDVSSRKLKRLQRRGKTRENLLCSEWYYTIEIGTGEEASFYSLGIVSFGHRFYFD